MYGYQSGDTLLHLAASRTKSTDLIRVLVHYGPDMLDIDAVDDRGESALHVVLRTSPFNLESLKQLLKLTPASSISSALQLACELRIAPAVRVLLMELQQPVSNDLIQLVHHWGSELASHESDDDVVRQTELKTQQCIEGMLNAHHQQQDVDAFLAESRNVPVHEFVQPWIHEAARARDFKLLQYCLDHGVNINATDRQFGNTPLLLGCDAHADNTSLDGETSSAQSGGFWMTADFNNTHMLLDEEDGVIDRSQASTSATRVYEPIPALAPPAVDLEFVRRILQVRECDINAQNRAGTTALMAAVSLGPSHMALVEVLCSQQPPPQLNLVNRAGCTALMLAALIGHESAVRLLLQRRADVDVRDNSGAKASQLAANDTIRMMLEQVETNSNCMIS
jgi:ankyrin repeat protein